MAVKIRLSRAGAKKTPHYRVIVADSRSPRDGRFLERVGTYNPLLPRGHPDRVKLKLERIQYWLDNGAKPSFRVATFLGAADVIPMPSRENPEKAKPKAKAQARLEELTKAEAEKAEAEKAEGENAATEKVATENAATENAATENAATEEVSLVNDAEEVAEENSEEVSATEEIKETAAAAPEGTTKATETAEETKVEEGSEDATPEVKD